MKKHIYYFTLVIFTLLFTSCTESDDEFFASTTVTSNGLVALNVTGNQLNISCYYARLLPQAGANPFDIYLTSSARKFFFNYTLEKKNGSGAWEYITPSTVTVVAGENQRGDYSSGIPILDALDTTYEYESDITLAAGQYRVSINPEIISLNAQDAVMVTINTSTAGIYSNTLEFTIL